MKARIVIVDPRNYQWHFNNPQIVGEFNFIDDHKKFNRIMPKRNKESFGADSVNIENNSVTEIYEPNLIGALSPNDRIEIESNSLAANVIRKNERDVEVKESKENGFRIEEANKEEKFGELGLNAKSKNESQNAIRKKNSIEQKEKEDFDLKLIKSESSQSNIIEKIIPLPSSKKVVEENELYRNELNNAIGSSISAENNIVSSNKNSNSDHVKLNNPIGNNSNGDVKNGNKTNPNKKKNGCCSIF